MVSLSILTKMFQSVILSMSAMDLDFIDPEVEAHIWTRGRWRRRRRSRSMELEEVVGDNEAIFRLERI